jgi:hypothetical protein
LAPDHGLIELSAGGKYLPDQRWRGAIIEERYAGCSGENWVTRPGEIVLVVLTRERSLAAQQVFVRLKGVSLR